VQIALNRTSPQPLYAQLAQDIQGRIRSGALPPGARLPTVRELEAICLKAMATDVGGRYQRASEFLEDLATAADIDHKLRRVVSQFHTPSERVQAVDIQDMDAAVLHAHEAGRLQLVQGTVRDLARQAAKACDLLLRDAQSV